MKQKELIPKYKVNDWVIVLSESTTAGFLQSFGHDGWKKVEPRMINQIYIETDPKYAEYGEDKLIRYRVEGLWFDQNDLKLISIENDPEYFL